MKLKLVGIVLAAALGSAPAHATFFFGSSTYGYASSNGKGTNWGGTSPTFGGFPIVSGGGYTKPGKPTTPTKPSKPTNPGGGWTPGGNNGGGNTGGGITPGGATDVPAPPAAILFGLGVAGLWLGRKLRPAR